MADAVVIKFPDGVADKTALDPGNSATYSSVSTTLTGGTETPTTGSVAAAGSLAVGQTIQIVTLSGIAPKSYSCTLTGVSGSALTWTPPLPFAPADSDIVRSNHPRRFLVGPPLRGAGNTAALCILQLPSTDAGQTANTYRWDADIPWNATSPTAFSYVGDAFVSLGGI